MDSHLLPPRSPLLTKFLPVFALAAFLPFLLFFVVNSPNLRFTSQADAQKELMLWFEPATIAARPGEKAQVAIMAEVPDTRASIFNVSATLISQDALSFTPTTISYPQPFTGRVLLGKVEVAAAKAGNYELTIPPELVTTSEQLVKVQTSSLKVIVSP